MDELINIKEHEGKPVVSSREVANNFEKEHSKVLRTIKGKIEVNPILASPKYFIESTYLDKSNRQSKEYLLTRDGFSFLVMGFTGAKADIWKLKYIEAFNKMEEYIRNQTPQLTKKEELQLAILNGTDLERIGALKEYEDVITKPLLDKIENDKPLVNFAETISQTADSISIGDFAKLVKDEGIKMGRNKLFKWLRGNKYLMESNVPYQKYIDNNYFELIEYSYKTPYGEKLTTKTLITGLGQIKIIEKLRKELVN